MEQKEIPFEKDGAASLRILMSAIPVAVGDVSEEDTLNVGEPWEDANEVYQVNINLRKTTLIDSEVHDEIVAALTAHLPTDSTLEERYLSLTDLQRAALLVVVQCRPYQCKATSLESTYGGRTGVVKIGRSTRVDRTPGTKLNPRGDASMFGRCLKILGLNATELTVATITSVQPVVLVSTRKGNWGKQRKNDYSLATPSQNDNVQNPNISWAQFAENATKAQQKKMLGLPANASDVDYNAKVAAATNLTFTQEQVDAVMKP